MTGRVPLADDAAAIAARLREIQAERASAIGCAPSVPAPSVPPSQMEMVLEAMRRAEARVRRTAAVDPPNTADDIIEHAIATKLVRHRVLSATWFLS